MRKDIRLTLATAGRRAGDVRARARGRADSSRARPILLRWTSALAQGFERSAAREGSVHARIERIACAANRERRALRRISFRPTSTM